MWNHAAKGLNFPSFPRVSFQLFSPLGVAWARGLGRVVCVQAEAVRQFSGGEQIAVGFGPKPSETAWQRARETLDTMRHGMDDRDRWWKRPCPLSALPASVSLGEVCAPVSVESTDAEASLTGTCEVK